MRFCWKFASNAKNGFNTHSLRLTQHPLDVMLQFDANTNAHANVVASVNGPLTFSHSLMWNFKSLKGNYATTNSFCNISVLGQKGPKGNVRRRVLEFQSLWCHSKVRICSFWVNTLFYSRFVVFLWWICSYSSFLIPTPWLMATDPLLPDVPYPIPKNCKSTTKKRQIRFGKLHTCPKNCKSTLYYYQDSKPSTLWQHTPERWKMVRHEVVHVIGSLSQV